MKEIWKLIELLNEYEIELNTGLRWRIDEKYWMLWRWLNLMWVDQYLISKHYWFIQWLVENDKIDLDMIREKLWIPCCVWYGSWRIIAVNDVKDYGQVLMLLSISDKPIEDLILYLK